MNPSQDRYKPLTKQGPIRQILVKKLRAHSKNLGSEVPLHCTALHETSPRSSQNLIIEQASWKLDLVEI